MDTITIVVKKPGEAAGVAQMENSGEAMHALVGGYIQFVPGHSLGLPSELAIYLNEDGKMHNLAPNLLLWDGLDIGAGTIFIAAADIGAVTNRSLTDVEIAVALGWCAARAVPLETPKTGHAILAVVDAGVTVKRGSDD